jgi:hypothetical protein
VNSVKFTILGAPCSKANSRRLMIINRRPAFIKSEAALQYERDVEKQLRAESRMMFSEPVRVTMHIYYESERPDLDESLILDCLQARYKRYKGPLYEVRADEFAYGKGERKLISKGVYLNDRLVREKHIYHHIDKLNPRTEIEVELITAQLFEARAA